jgi:hypothetical protein
MVTYIVKLQFLAAVWYVFLKYWHITKFDETKDYSSSRIDDDLPNPEQYGSIW